MTAVVAFGVIVLVGVALFAIKRRGPYDPTGFHE